MNSCPTGAVERRPEGEIYFQYDMCIGCGNCAIACPYDSIAMIETGKFDRAQAKKAAAVGRPFYRPYPVASHCAEPGLWERISAGHARGEHERLGGGSLRKYAIATIRSEPRRKLRSRQGLMLRLHFRSSATCVMDCPSWDVCTIAQPARRCAFLRRPCSDKRRRSEGARPRSVKLAEAACHRRPESEHRLELASERPEDFHDRAACTPAPACCRWLFHVLSIDTARSTG